MIGPTARLAIRPSPGEVAGPGEAKWLWSPQAKRPYFPADGRRCASASGACRGTTGLAVPIPDASGRVSHPPGTPVVAALVPRGLMQTMVQGIFPWSNPQCRRLRVWMRGNTNWEAAGKGTRKEGTQDVF